MKIRKVGVLGAGLMGSGIAEVAAKAGYDTVVREVTEDLAKKGMGRIQSSLSKAVEKGKLAASDRDAVAGRLRSTTALEDLAAQTEHHQHAHERPRSCARIMRA